MDQRPGVLRIAVFRLNVVLNKGDGGDRPPPDTDTTPVSVVQTAQPGENSGLRILTDPDAAEGPLLRFRQDQRRGLLSLSDVSGKTDAVTVRQMKAPGFLAPKDPA